MPMDAKIYLEKKEKGLVALAKVGNAAIMSWKRFDPETGSEVDPVVEAISKENLSKTRDQAAGLVSGIDAMIKDVEALG